MLLGIAVSALTVLSQSGAEQHYLFLFTIMQLYHFYDVNTVDLNHLPVP